MVARLLQPLAHLLVHLARILIQCLSMSVTSPFSQVVSSHLLVGFQHLHSLVQVYALLLETSRCRRPIHSVELQRRSLCLVLQLVRFQHLHSTDQQLHCGTKSMETVQPQHHRRAPNTYGNSLKFNQYQERVFSKTLSFFIT